MNAYTATPVRRVRDADGAHCPECGIVFGTLWDQPVPWSWRKRQYMHEQGTGHTMQLFKVDGVEAAA